MCSRDNLVVKLNGASLVTSKKSWLSITISTSKMSRTERNDVQCCCLTNDFGLGKGNREGRQRPLVILVSISAVVAFATAVESEYTCLADHQQRPKVHVESHRVDESSVDKPTLTCMSQAYVGSSCQAQMPDSLTLVQAQPASIASNTSSRYLGLHLAHMAISL